mmetsp:Transcript_131298/g.331598  ORF Transcript_131298/g.331598 Transcript_131298/m.331598 type:complete len:89 (-) Transcript_131298:593-859(-)
MPKGDLIGSVGLKVSRAAKDLVEASFWAACACEPGLCCHIDLGGSSDDPAGAASHAWNQPVDLCAESAPSKGAGYAPSPGLYSLETST